MSASAWPLLLHGPDHFRTPECEGCVHTACCPVANARAGSLPKNAASRDTPAMNKVTCFARTALRPCNIRFLRSGFWISTSEHLDPDRGIELGGSVATLRRKSVSRIT